MPSSRADWPGRPGADRLLTTVMTRSPAAGAVSVGAVFLFWVGVFSAGPMVDGYSAREDFISSLASRGSPVAGIGICALLASAVAHLAAGRAVQIGWPSRLCAWSLFAAFLAGTAVAAFRQSCPDGPARCTPVGDWVDAVHRAGVGAYEAFALVAMVTLAVGALRGPSPWPRWLGLVSLAAAVGSLVLLAQTNGNQPGLWQRLWLADNHTWLLLVAATATVDAGRASYGRNRAARRA